MNVHDNSNLGGENWAGAILILVAAGLIIFGLLLREPKPSPPPQYKSVVAIGDCTGAASNAWSGYHAGLCSVTYDDGSKAVVGRPVDIGDKVRK